MKADDPVPTPEAPGRLDLERLRIDLLTPLRRFVQRSRVKPTDGQIAHAIALIDQIEAKLAPLAAGGPAGEDEGAARAPQVETLAGHIEELPRYVLKRRAMVVSTFPQPDEYVRWSDVEAALRAGARDTPEPVARYPGDLGSDDDHDGAAFHHQNLIDLSPAPVVPVESLRAEVLYMLSLCESAIMPSDILKLHESLDRLRALVQAQPLPVTAPVERPIMQCTRCGTYCQDMLCVDGSADTHTPAPVTAGAAPPVQSRADLVRAVKDIRAEPDLSAAVEIARLLLSPHGDARPQPEPEDR